VIRRGLTPKGKRRSEARPGSRDSNQGNGQAGVEIANAEANRH